jgi:SAM-dependent methyltransferase
MQYTGERVVPWNPGVGAEVLGAHLVRYALAAQIVYGREVVDLGCGCGYGSLMLSFGARFVTGVDDSAEALAFARTNFRAPNLAWQRCNLMDYSPTRAGVFVALEVLEHLDEPRALLERLRAGSVLIWSLPVGDGSTFHKRAYTVDDVVALVGEPGYVQDRGGMIWNYTAEIEPAHLIGVRVL